jgi:CspA family cold shock protein
VRWHRTGFRRYWRWKSRSTGGRPQIDADLRALIRWMSIEKFFGGAAFMASCSSSDFRWLSRPLNSSLCTTPIRGWQPNHGQNNIRIGIGGPTMARGTVKWFNSQKGYGFIQPQGGGGRDVFVHISAVERAGLSSLNEGQVIEYEIVENRGKQSAENLKVSR